MQAVAVELYFVLMLTCRPAERTTFGVLDKEMEEIELVSTKMHINAHELVYFLVCAKLPCYISKVDKSLRRSFVEAAVSLYYLERYYLVASISNLFEVGPVSRAHA